MKSLAYTRRFVIHVQGLVRKFLVRKSRSGRHSVRAVHLWSDYVGHHSQIEIETDGTGPMEH